MTLQFEDLMRAVDPACGFPDYTADDRDRLLRPVLAEPTPLAPRRRSRWRHTRWLPAAAAAVLAIGMLVVPGLGLFPSGATAAAKGLLDKAIVAAVDPPTRPDQYWRITIDSITNDLLDPEGRLDDPNSAWALRHSQRISYVAVDGSRPSWHVDRTGPFIRQVSGPPTALPEEGWTTTEVWTTDLSEREQDYIGILDLPTDPEALRAELYRIGHEQGASEDEGTLEVIAGILQSGYAPAELRAALFEVIKTVPGVDLVDQNVTLSGRSGIALGRAEPARDGERRELIFDRETAEVIGERHVWVEPDMMVESALSRELVDRVDPEVLRDAQHYDCELEDGGVVKCSPQ